MKPNPQTTAELYDHTADEITAHVLGYLRSKGYVCWAQDNRGRFNPKTGKWYPHPNNRIGVADILGWRKSDARFIAVEVKAGRDQLSSYQDDFLKELRADGGVAMVARSFERFRESFERQGLHLPMATTAAPTDAAAPPALPMAAASAAIATPDAARAPAAPTRLPGLTAISTEPIPAP